MSQYTMDDVQQILRGSDELNRQQDEIRKFLAMICIGQEDYLGSWSVTATRYDPSGVKVEVELSWSGGLYVSAFIGSYHHELWNRGRYQPLKAVFIEPVSRHLPVMLNVLSGQATSVIAYANFLQTVESR